MAAMVFTSQGFAPDWANKIRINDNPSEHGGSDMPPASLQENLNL